jgi:lysozyme family protein
MTSEPYFTALGAVLKHEGGFSDHNDDPGGATNQGVTLATFRQWYGEQQTVEDLRRITAAQLALIYHQGYWAACHCDQLPVGIAYVVFDQAVHSGPRQSMRWLQEAVGAERDGLMGPKTLTAVGQHAAGDIIRQMCVSRIRFLHSLHSGGLWQTFGRGWQRRVDGVCARGLQMTWGEG